jgi:hypothetical protein
MSEREKALEAALRDIARQRKTDEMPREDRHNGDFEGACDTMIDVARAALAMPSTVDGADFLRGWEAGRDAAKKAAGDYCWRRTKESGVLKSPAVFTTHTWQDIQQVIANLTPPEDKP